MCSVTNSVVGAVRLTSRPLTALSARAQSSGARQKANHRITRARQHDVRRRAVFTVGFRVVQQLRQRPLLAAHRHAVPPQREAVAGQAPAAGEQDHEQRAAEQRAAAPMQRRQSPSRDGVHRHASSSASGSGHHNQARSSVRRQSGASRLYVSNAMPPNNARNSAP
ncbi:hypothetical protein NFX37_03075 [Serratia marcescens]|nr:hypothetical protein NFX37_03075 [Serratia marcescens]